MKNILIVILIITTCITSCLTIFYMNKARNEKVASNKKVETEKVIVRKLFKVQIGIYTREFEVTEIDSCEYLTTGIGSSHAFGFHKGNCKFCIERSKSK